MNEMEGAAGGAGEERFPENPGSGADGLEGADGAGLAGPGVVRRWWMALGLLVLYIAVPMVIGLGRGRGEEAVLPETSLAVLKVTVLELGLFGAVFGVAAWLGRLRGGDLFLAWRGGGWVFARALGWSVALRLAVGMVLGAVLFAVTVAGVLSRGELETVRPRVEAMVEIGALKDPVYLALMLTVVSFVLAGLREELWRAGMLALLGRVWPRGFGGRAGAWRALVPVAILFGLGHAVQGPYGMAATALLGMGLGAVMLVHRSLWDAVLAHGFFNATTFGLLVAFGDRLAGMQ